MEKIAVNLMNSPQGNVLTILEGEALELKHPEKIYLKGRIETVRQYLDARKGTSMGQGSLQHINKDLAVITIDEDALSIHLDVDPNNPFGTEVTGQLQVNPELLQFNIEKPHRYSRESLRELMRFTRRFFPDRVEYENVFLALQKLKISSTTDIQKDSDARGNNENIYKKSVDSAGIPQTFKLQLPLYRGQVPRTFTVDLCLDVTDAGVKFYLQSVEMVELLESNKKEIIQAELAGYLDYCIIWK